MSKEFQSTLPREERRYDDAVDKWLKDFNPRSHERSDVSHREKRQDIINFNPRSHERSDCHRNTLIFAEIYFNPRSHERSDTLEQTAGLNNIISIHAPTRGATETCGQAIDWSDISIHAPTRGATNTLKKY